MGLGHSRPAIAASKALAGLAVAVFAISLGAWTAKEKRVKVTIADATRQTRIFEPGRPHPPGMPNLKGEERAACQSAFNARVGVRCAFQKIGFEPAKLAAQFTDIEVETSLACVLWLPGNHTQPEKDHEEAHARISERVYAELAEKTARLLGAKYLGRKTRQFLMYEDYEKLAQDATRQAAQEISTEWFKAVAAEASRANDRFDALTDHGRNDMPIEQAIEQAFAKDRR
jgi:hypothetical protein